MFGRAQDRISKGLFFKAMVVVVTLSQLLTVPIHDSVVGVGLSAKLASVASTSPTRGGSGSSGTCNGTSGKNCDANLLEGTKSVICMCLTRKDTRPRS